MEDICEHLFKLAAPYLEARGNQEHTEMAFSFAKELQEILGGRKEIIFPAIILHDVGWSVIMEGQHGQAFGPDSDPEMNRLHETEGAKIAATLLQDVPLSQADKEEICRIIESHDSGENPITLEEKIVKDADKLFRFTPQGFAFVAYHINLDPIFFRNALEVRINKWLFTEAARTIALNHLAANNVGTCE